MFETFIVEISGMFYSVTQSPRIIVYRRHLFFNNGLLGSIQEGFTFSRWIFLLNRIFYLHRFAILRVVFLWLLRSFFRRLSLDLGLELSPEPVLELTHEQLLAPLHFNLRGCSPRRLVLSLLMVGPTQLGLLGRYWCLRGILARVRLKVPPQMLRFRNTTPNIFFFFWFFWHFITIYIFF